ncbi:DUF6894 family protein [Bradyrhizobium manausense]|uniref:DUF6894 family protein n=1 Tax=Bradyrhizobium manausense TaxID=989370 RepID=UPI003D313BF1
MCRDIFSIDNVAPTVDCEGEELPDDESARREATSYAGALSSGPKAKVGPAVPHVSSRG